MTIDPTTEKKLESLVVMVLQAVDQRLADTRAQVAANLAERVAAAEVALRADFEAELAASVAQVHADAERRITELQAEFERRASTLETRFESLPQGAVVIAESTPLPLFPASERMAPTPAAEEARANEPAPIILPTLATIAVQAEDDPEPIPVLAVTAEPFAETVTEHVTGPSWETDDEHVIEALIEAVDEQTASTEVEHDAEPDIEPTVEPMVEPTVVPPVQIDDDSHHDDDDSNDDSDGDSIDIAQLTALLSERLTSMTIVPGASD